MARLFATDCLFEGFACSPCYKQLLGSRMGAGRSDRICMQHADIWSFGSEGTARRR